MPAPELPSISIASSLACISAILDCIWLACFIRPARFFMGRPPCSLRRRSRRRAGRTRGMSRLGCRGGSCRGQAVRVGTAIVHRAILAPGKASRMARTSGWSAAACAARASAACPARPSVGSPAAVDRAMVQRVPVAPAAARRGGRRGRAAPPAAGRSSITGGREADQVDGMQQVAVQHRLARWRPGRRRRGSWWARGSGAGGRRRAANGGRLAATAADRHGAHRDRRPLGWRGGARGRCRCRRLR